MRGGSAGGGVGGFTSCLRNELQADRWTTSSREADFLSAVCPWCSTGRAARLQGRRNGSEISQLTTKRASCLRRDRCSITEGRRVRWDFNGRIIDSACQSPLPPSKPRHIKTDLPLSQGNQVPPSSQRLNITLKTSF